MKLFDFAKKVGAGVIKELPMGNMILDGVNALLPNDVKLPTSATGEDLKSAIDSLPPAERARVMEAQLAVDEKLVEARGAVVIAEAKGESWLQRNWRPATMLIMVLTCVAYVFDWFGARSVDTSVIEKFIELVKLGLGGYVISRSVEKVTTNSGVLDAIKHLRK